MKISEHFRSFQIGKIPVIGQTETGSLIGLDEDGKIFVEKLKADADVFPVTEKETELYEALKDGKYLLSDEDSEEDAGGITSAYLHITQNCNLHCIGCYSYNKERNHSIDADTNQMKTAIRRLAQAGLKNLVISGGEPFLRSDLPQLLAYAREQGIPRIDIITNGTVLCEEKLKAVKPYVDTIAVSTDGFSEEHDHFIRDRGIYQKVRDAVRQIRSQEIPASVLPTVHRKNLAFLDEYVRYARELDAELSFSLLTCPPYSMDEEETPAKAIDGEKEERLSDYLFDEEQLRYLGDKMTHLGMEHGVHVLDSPQDLNFSCNASCGVCRKICSVGYDGTVYPCHMLHYDALKLGNIFEEDLKTIMQKPAAKKIRSLEVDAFESCGTCKYKYLCGGGCRARSYFTHQNFISGDIYCPMTKDYFVRTSAMLEEMYTK